MAVYVLQRTGRLVPRVLQRWASAAAVPLTDKPPYFEDSTPESRKPPEDVKVSKLSNGVTVASLETHSVSSSLSLHVRAGSRFETYHQQGLTHTLRNAAFLCSGERSTFKIAREMDYVGGTLSASSTREHMVYAAQFLRGNQELAMDIIANAVTSPMLKEWEICDLTPKMELDVAMYEADPSSIVMEEVHRAAFRNALSNSLYCPRHNIGAFSSNDLKEYMEDWFLGKRMTLVGIGVDHQELVSMAESSLSAIKEGLSIPEEASEYIGGGEVQIATRSSFTHAAIICKGTSMSSQKDVLIAGVLHHLLGTGPSVKWGSSSSRLAKAGSAVVDSPFNTCALNVNYSDNGVFGLYIISEPQDSGKLLQAVMQEFNAVAKGNVSDADLTRAKNQLKSSYLMTVENTQSLSQDIATQASLKGSYSPMAGTSQQVDSLTREDIIQFAKTVFGSRATFVAHGNLSSTPRLQQLVGGVSLR